MVTQARSNFFGLNSSQKNTFFASWLGFAMDSFDYFLLVLILPQVIEAFHVNKIQGTYLLTATLVARPIGALIFGYWADKVGRRLPLMVVVLGYSLVGFLCAFAPSFTILFILRFLYGIGMGGEWGLGAAFTMETVPVNRRGIFSGFLQGGYPAGYLFAALAKLVLIDQLHLSWRYMFGLSIIPALISIWVRFKVEESQTWEKTSDRMVKEKKTLFGVFFSPKILLRFVYLIILMTVFMSFTHGTQDLYPSFLSSTNNHGVGFSQSTATIIVTLYNVAAIVGSIFFGSLSDRFSRKTAIVAAALVALPFVPMFAYGHGWLILIGSMAMQFSVQGAWANIPVHLVEVSPPELRGLMGGFAYQLGAVITGFDLPVQQKLAEVHGFPFALTVFAVAASIGVAVLTFIGPDQTKRSFL